MKKLVVCQHVPYEILGTFHPLLKREGFRIRYVNFGRHPDAQPSLRRVDGLIVLGGSMSVNQMDEYPHLATEVKLIQQALEKDIPILGICLGSQLIAKALGAEVFPNPEKEIGWYDVSVTQAGKVDPLFSCFQETEKLFQWHGDTFTLPAGAELLATSKLCANQAYRYRDNVYGLQFHLEVDKPLVERWLVVPENQNDLAEVKGKIDPQVIQQETDTHIHALEQLSERTFGAFTKLFGEVKRPHQRLLSR